MRQLLLTLGLLSLSFALPASETSEEEISYLISFVSASGCTFHRNGTDHPATEAAEHLQLKIRRGSRYADSAEHFIDRLASASSWSGKPYRVTCEGKTEPSRDWLYRALGQHRADSR